MLKKLFNLFKNYANNNKSALTSKPIKKRKLQFETLESRDMLSVNPFLPNLDEIENEYYIASCLPDDGRYDVTAAAIPDSAITEAAPFDLDDTFKLHSKPDSHFTIYLDFDGFISSTNWKGDRPAWDPSNDGANFNDLEKSQIQQIWQIVAEDFLPFDVDVTTEDPGTERLRKTGGSDTDWGIRCVIGGNANGEGWGGIATVGSFRSSSDKPCYVIDGMGMLYTGGCISHEVGHTLGLAHDGGTPGTNGTEYYTGLDGWVPIMGSNQKLYTLEQWSNGDYTTATNHEDDLQILTNPNYTGKYGKFGYLSYRADDHGNLTSSATQLTLTDNEIFVTGIIERNTDLDYFTFTLDTKMIVDFSILTGPFANLDVLAKLYNSSDTLLYTSDPQNTLNASFSAITLSAGVYYLSIDGTGKEGVYSDYGSLGAYTITGSIAPIAVPLNLKKTAIDKNSISVAWDAVTDATGYSIQYSTDQQQWTTIENITETSYTINGLESSSYHYIRVRAEGNNGNSGWSNPIYARSDDKFESNNSPQTAYDLGLINGYTVISDLVFAGDGNDDYYKITLAGKNSSSKIRLDFAYDSNYLKVEIFTYSISSSGGASGNNGYWILNIGPATSIQANETYILRVTPLNGTVQKEHYSITFDVPTVPLPPAAPVNFTGVSQTHDSVTLNWNMQSNLSSYKLEYKKTSVSTWQTWTAPDISATSATITGLDALTQYDFRLTATNANGSRNSITTATTKVLLPTPQNLRAESNGKTAVALDWNNVAGASEYILQREISAGNWTQIYKGLDSKFVDKNLTAGTEYSYRVQAVGSDFSDAVKVKTLATDVADVPIIITSEIDVDDKVKLEWTDLGSEYYYYVFRNGSLLSAGQQNTIYVDNKPLTGIHEYYVYAYNENTGKWSNALPVVMVADTIKSKVDAEIFSHEISPDGKIELNWSPINNAQQIIIFRNGVPVSTILGSQDTTWTDQSPNNNKNNEYVIYVGYLDDFNRTNWTWSSPYVVKKATTTSPSTAAIPIPNTDIFNEFWANYDL